MRANEIITELKGAKTHINQGIDNIFDLKDYMEGLGFTYIAGGEFSLVFQGPSDLVVKVYNDECYDEFIKFCLARPTNPFLPKFRGRGVRLTPDARMIRIERLLPIPPSEWQKAGVQTITAIVRSDDDVDMWDLNDSQKALYQTIKNLYNEMASPCWLDIHAGNVMMRPSGQLVIIDPFAPSRNGWHSTHKKKRKAGR